MLWKKSVVYLLNSFYTLLLFRSSLLNFSLFFLIFVLFLICAFGWQIIALARAIFCHSEAKSGVWCFKTGSWVRYFLIYFVFSSEYRNFAFIIE